MYITDSNGSVVWGESGELANEPNPLSDGHKVMNALGTSSSRSWVAYPYCSGAVYDFEKTISINLSPGTYTFHVIGQLRATESSFWMDDSDASSTFTVPSPSGNITVSDILSTKQAAVGQTVTVYGDAENTSLLNANYTVDAVDKDTGSVLDSMNIGNVASGNTVTWIFDSIMPSKQWNLRFELVFNGWA